MSIHLTKRCEVYANEAPRGWTESRVYKCERCLADEIERAKEVGREFFDYHLRNLEMFRKERKHDPISTVSMVQRRKHMRAVESDRSYSSSDPAGLLNPFNPFSPVSPLNPMWEDSAKDTIDNGSSAVRVSSDSCNVRVESVSHDDYHAISHDSSSYDSGSSDSSSSSSGGCD